jgi:predicted phosphodiesterase
MPDDVPWKKIKIYLLGDMHYGSKSFDAEAFDVFLKLVLEKDYAFLIGIGDLMENALGDSVGGAIYDQDKNPTEQILGVRELIRPIAHKIICMVPGNHEWRSWKAANLDPLQFGICEYHNIPYFSEPVHIDILWRGKIFPFYAKHGSTNSQTKGGKLNAAARPLSFNQFVMFTVSGHTHDPMTDKNIKRCREYIRDENGNIVNMKIVKRTEYTVVCPSFYEPWGNYGSRADFNPVSDGFVQACVIEPNGKYYVDKKPLIIPGR